MKTRQLCLLSFILFLIATAASAQVTFTDVAETAGLAIYILYATWGDYDNDGNADILLTDSPRKRLYRNEGDGTFVDVTEIAGITGTGPNAPFFLDFDNDGNLDLFMSANNSTHGDLLYRNVGDGTFVDVSPATGMESKARAQQYLNWDAVSFDYDNDGLLDIFIANARNLIPVPNFLYRNEGNGHFEEVAAQVGLDNPRRAGIVPGDYDNDGDLDLFITVVGDDDFFDPDPDDQGIDMLYRNEGGGVFIDVAKQAGVQRNASP